MDEQNGPEPRRGHPRRSRMVEARVMEDGKWHECRILNISAGGAKLSVGCDFTRGAPVVLEIGQFGQYRGSVIWANGQELGIKFGHDPAEMAEVVIGTAIYG